MSVQLVRYEAARSALAEAHRFDEVKDIRDKAEAMAAYARQAKDQDLILWATEIKVRAERKCGAMLAESAEHGERNTGGKPSKAATVSPPTLSDIGITRDQSSRYQQLASMSEEHFEAAVATAKDTAGQVSTAFMLREAAKHKPQGKPMKGKRADEMREELKAASERGASMLCTYARLLLGAIQASEGFTADECRLLDEVAAAITQARSASA